MGGTKLRPIVELVRLEEDEDYGTFGVLKVQKLVFCVTLEPPDRENLVGRSSIPVQQYICRRYSSEKYPNTFQVMDVPGRTYVLFHAGNVVGNTAGCILLGQYYGKLRAEETRRGILNSGNTMKEFLRLMINHDEFHLTVKEMF